MARDLLRAGGPKALVERAASKVRMSAPARSQIPAPPYETVIEVPAEPWPADLPLVSIIVPNYNNGVYLEQCLTSLQQLTMNRFEVLVVDSASNDMASVEALRLVQATPPVPFKVIQRDERHLLGCNRNAGWQAARGRYVCFLDPDDRLAPTYLDACLFHLEVQAYDVVGTGVQYFEGSSGWWGDMPLMSSLQEALDRCPTSAPALVRRDLLEAAGGFHDTGLGHRLIYEDWKFWVRALALGARLRNVPARLLEVRVHPGGQSRQAGIPSMQQQRAAIAEYNADVLDDAALVRSRQLARTRCRVPGFEGVLGTSAHPSSVMLLMDDVTAGRSQVALAGALDSWRQAGLHVVVLAEGGPSPRGEDWAGAAGLGTADVHVLGQQLPREEWLDYCRYLTVARNVQQVWRLLQRRPSDFAARVATDLPDTIVVDVVADDFEPLVIV